jgi:hypothetical protein
VYAWIAASTSWTWEYIGQCLTLPRLFAMNDHWRVYPPVHISVAAFMGTGRRSSVTAANEAAPFTNADLVRDMHTPVHKLKWQNHHG